MGNLKFSFKCPGMLGLKWKFVTTLSKDRLTESRQTKSAALVPKSKSSAASYE